MIPSQLTDMARAYAETYENTQAIGSGEWMPPNGLWTVTLSGIEVKDDAKFNNGPGPDGQNQQIDAFSVRFVYSMLLPSPNPNGGEVDPVAKALLDSLGGNSSFKSRPFMLPKNPAEISQAKQKYASFMVSKLKGAFEKILRRKGGNLMADCVEVARLCDPSSPNGNPILEVRVTRTPSPRDVNRMFAEDEIVTNTSASA